jgi:hypothetical protein
MRVSQYGKQIPGVVSGIMYGQYERATEIDKRISSRNVPDSPLPPNFDPRPVLSRYALFPILDNRLPATVPIAPIFDYNLEKTFTPPVMETGPVSGYINNVAVESGLRNQYFALNRGAAPQAVYIPSSNSDLYKVSVPSRPSDQPFPGLFTQTQFSQSLHPNIATAPNVGVDTFHNNTRTQLR